MELIREFLSFAWSVFYNWAGFATGGVIVALVWFWSVLKKKPPSQKFGLFLAALFLLFAFFTACREQYRNSIAKQQQIDALTVTDFHPRIEAAWLTKNAVPGIKREGTYVICRVTTENRGAPSAIAKTEATFALPSGQVIRPVFPFPPTNKRALT